MYNRASPIGARVSACAKEREGTNIMNTLKSAALLSAAFFLAACSGSPDRAAQGLVSETPPPITEEGRAGVNYNIYLDSDVDGEVIAFTVMEPPTVATGLTAPLIFESHGYSGSRKRAPDSGMLAALHAEGFGFISLDERGNGESGGTVRILDPAFEGQDWLQVLDWAEENLEWLRYENTADQIVAKDAPDANPVMGAVGGSYGGGYQHLIYALDPKHRLDAIAPDITWNDLRYSLFPGGVFKSQWATLLAGLGSTPPNTQDQEVQEGLAQGLSNNSLDQGKLDLLYRNSLASHCAGENDYTAPGGLTPIDSFYTQSAHDTLFNFNDAKRNYDCVNALGGDVRFYIKTGGHGLSEGDSSETCGGVGRTDATVAWYREKLLHQAGDADVIPDICIQLGSNFGDSVSLASIPVGTADAVDVAVGVVPTGTAGASPSYFTVYDGAVDGANALAGIATVTVDMHVPVVGGEPPAAPSTRADPIVFMGLGIREGDAGQVTHLQAQMQPFRGYKTDFAEELVGVAERVSTTQQVVLIVQGDFAPQYAGNSSVPSSTVDVNVSISLPLIGDVASIESAP